MSFIGRLFSCSECPLFEDNYTAYRVDVRDLLEELEREDRVMERGELVRFFPRVPVIDQDVSRVRSKKNVAGLDCDHAVHLD